MSAFGQYAAVLIKNGYSPVPILPGSKRPLPACDYYGHWNELRERALTTGQVSALSKWRPDLGLGVAGGYNCLTPTDFDTTDPEIKRAAARAIPRMRIAKVGQKGGTGFFWNSDGMIEGCKFKRKLEDGGWDMLVEVLVTGQSVLPPTIHPSTNLPYRWVTDATLFNTKIDDLPEISLAHIEALACSLSRWTAKPAKEYSEPSTFKGEPLSPDERMKAWATAALRSEADALSGFSQGRNIGIFHAGCAVGKYMWHRVLTKEEIEKELLDASARNGYNSVKHGGKEKAFKSLHSGLNKARNDNLPRLNASVA